MRSFSSPFEQFWLPELHYIASRDYEIEIVDKPTVESLRKTIFRSIYVMCTIPLPSIPSSYLIRIIKTTETFTHWQIRLCRFCFWKSWETGSRHLRYKISILFLSNCSQFVIHLSTSQSALYSEIFSNRWECVIGFQTRGRYLLRWSLRQNLALSLDFRLPMTWVYLGNRDPNCITDTETRSIWTEIHEDARSLFLSITGIRGEPWKIEDEPWKIMFYGRIIFFRLLWWIHDCLIGRRDHRPSIDSPGLPLSDYWEGCFWWNARRRVGCSNTKASPVQPSSPLFLRYRHPSVIQRLSASPGTIFCLRNPTRCFASKRRGWIPPRWFLSFIYTARSTPAESSSSQVQPTRSSTSDHITLHSTRVVQLQWLEPRTATVLVIRKYQVS